MTMYSAALDLSGKAAVMAVVDQDGKVLLDKNRPMKGRESAQLASWVVDELKSININVNDIHKWTIGSGPGSFTGMRLVAALVTGWSSLRAVTTRCVPTAVAIAAQSSAQVNERIAVLFDGRNKELLAFEVERNANGEFLVANYSAVWSKEEAIQMLKGDRFEHFVMLQDDQNACQTLLGEENTKTVEFIPTLSVLPLVNSTQFEFDNDLTRLVYIRPAVYS